MRTAHFIQNHQAKMYTFPLPLLLSKLQSAHSAHLENKQINANFEIISAAMKINSIYTATKVRPSRQQLRRRVTVNHVARSQEITASRFKQAEQVCQ